MNEMLDQLVDTSRKECATSADDSVRPEGKTPDVLEELTIEMLWQYRPDLVQSLLMEQADEVQQLRSELKERDEREAVRHRHEQIRELLEEFELPDPALGDAWAQTAVSPRFLAELLAAPDTAAVRDFGPGASGGDPHGRQQRTRRLTQRYATFARAGNSGTRGRN